MILTNKEILVLYEGITQIMTIPTKGKMKFKTLKNYNALTKCKEVIADSFPQEAINEDGTIKAELPTKTFDEVKEILEETQEVDLSLFDIEEIEDLEISAVTLQALEKVIKEG